MYNMTLQAETANLNYDEQGWREVTHRNNVMDVDDLQEAFQTLADSIGYNNYNVTIQLNTK